MKEIKITPPDGYEIDKDNSTFEKIIFKEVKKKLPKRWEGLDSISGYYVDYRSCIVEVVKNHPTYTNVEDVFFSRKQAEASIALAQLSQLREVYRQGWKPDWSDSNDKKWIIAQHYDKLKIFRTPILRQFLSFQSEQIAEKFLDNFRDLIEQASPLLFD